MTVYINTATTKNIVIVIIIIIIIITIKIMVILIRRGKVGMTGHVAGKWVSKEGYLTT